MSVASATCRQSADWTIQPRTRHSQSQFQKLDAHLHVLGDDGENGEDSKVLMRKHDIR